VNRSRNWALRSVDLDAHEILQRDAKKPAADKYHITWVIQEHADAKMLLCFWELQVHGSVPSQCLGVEAEIQDL
jgi:hypothetical protein